MKDLRLVFPRVLHLLYDAAPDAAGLLLTTPSPETRNHLTPVAVITTNILSTIISSEGLTEIRLPVWSR